MLRKAPEVAVYLMVPVFKARKLCDALDLVLTTTAPTASIRFLQCDKIKRGNQIRYIFKGLLARRERHQVLPATQEVMMKAAGADSYLYVKGEESDAVARARGACERPEGSKLSH